MEMLARCCRLSILDMEELDSDSEARRLITLIRRDLVSWSAFEHRLLSALEPEYQEEQLTTC
jgi:hypothetical protein